MIDFDLDFDLDSLLTPDDSQLNPDAAALLSRFDSVQELPVSEETLGAYLEGSLDGEELDDVELAIQYQPEINNLCEEVKQIYDSSIFSNNISDGFNSDIASSSPNNLGDVETDNVFSNQDLLQDFDLPDIGSLSGEVTNNLGNEDDIFGIDLSNDIDLNF